MSHTIATKFYSLLMQIENKHNFDWADGLHRKILKAVMDAHLNNIRLNNNHIVDLNLTSRSSTYRKIADLKQFGFLSETWDNMICYLTLGPAAIEMLADTDKKLKALNEKPD